MTRTTRSGVTPWIVAWRLSLPVSLLVLLGVHASPPDDFDPVRAKTERYLRERELPSIVVAAARDGRVAWEEGFGWADRERRIPAEPHTPYSIASVTKPFTAAAVMRLVESRRLDLDRPANDYLGEAKLAARAGDAAEATVRRLLNHTSGLPPHHQFFYEDEPGPPPSPDETIRCYGNLIQPSGRHLYSNLGYGILGEVAARVAGRRYADVMREEVFAPLGLVGSFVPVRREDVPEAAVRYGMDGRPLPFYVTDHAGASDVFASARDLVRFGLSHVVAQHPTLLAERSVQEMHRPGEGRYGLGWRVKDDWHGHRVLWHSGAMPGVAATLWVVPSARTAVAVLSNRTGAPVNQLAEEILAVLLDVELPPAAPELVRAPRRVGATRAKRPRIDRALAGTWRGTVAACPVPRALALRVHGSGVQARLEEGAWCRVEIVSATDDQLSGAIAGDRWAPGPGAPERSLRLALRVRDDDALRGTLTVRTERGARGSNAVTYWTELRRVPARQATSEP